MKKKILLGLATVAVVIAGVALTSAFEAHIINVTAQIENGLTVTPDEIMFGTVFPQEHLFRNLRIGLSESFITEDRADDVYYMIKQKPKCVDGAGIYVPVDPETHICPAETTEMPSLCEYLSKTPDGEPDNDKGLPAFHQKDASAYGRLAKSEGDEVDDWIIDLAVPCFAGHCDQGYAAWVRSINEQADPWAFVLPTNLEHEVFGCDLWIEITGTSRQIPLYEETGDQSTELGRVKGYVTYDTKGSGLLTGTVKVDDGYLDDSGHYLLVLNGPRDASVAVGSTNALLANKACETPGTGGDGWWVRQTDNTGATKCVLAPDDVKLEGYYNFSYGISINGVDLEAGYDFSVALTPGIYSEVQFLVKDLDSGWATILEYPGVGEGGGPSEFSFTIY